MRRLTKILCTGLSIGLAATAIAVPQMSVLNDRIYRVQAGNELQYRGGQLWFIMYDGLATSSVECGGVPIPLGPFRPGNIACPAGHNAFVSRRFGDRDQDVINLWFRLGSVQVASRIPARLPELIEFDSGPLTTLPRPIRDFKDRSTLVLHDLQSATFSEKDATRYEKLEEYIVLDADSNSDGELTDLERSIYSQLASVQELDHLRDTIINTGNFNGFAFTYPLRPWIELNKDLNPNLAPRDTVTVSQLQFIEAYPGISNRAGITNTFEGFRFTNLDSIGTDFDGDPALLIDYRNPSFVSWSGNNTSNLISGLDQLLMKVFERRFDAMGTPVSYTGTDRIQFSEVRVGDDPAVDPVLVTAPLRLEQDPLQLLAFGTYGLAGHGLASGDEVFLYETGYSVLDGQRFYANIQSSQIGFVAQTQFELFLDEGLNQPLLLPSLPDGTLGVLNPAAAGAANVPDIVISPGEPALITTLAPHGLANGDSFTLEGTGLTPFENQVLFAGNTTANTLEVFTDAAQTVAFAYALPTPLELSTIQDLAAGDPDPYVKGFQRQIVDGAVVLESSDDFEFPVYPFPFVDQSFGGQLLLPSVFDRGYDFPDAAFSIFFGSPVGALNISTIPDIPRNDLIMRLRFSRNIATANRAGGQALVPGDLSRRDFEVELCLVDTFEGAAKALSTPLFGKSKSDKSDDDGLGPNDDYDGDGQSNLYEFAFDVNGSMVESVPAFGDAGKQVSAQVSVEIDPETSFCELTIGKRPGVREYFEYYFEEVDFNGNSTKISPDGSNWELVEDSDTTYKVVSKQPVSGSSFYRACAQKNSFGQ